MQTNFTLSLLLAGGCLLCGTPAQAAVGDAVTPADTAGRTYGLNPVVVTGTGTHQRLKDTPAPVTVISASDIRRAGITDFQQAMQALVPALSFSPNAMGSYLTMNGLSNRYVLLLVNGRKLTGDISGNIDINQIDMSRVKRIEVLDGAASSLYGSDAIGGVINIITDEPRDEASFSSQSRYTAKNQFSQGLNLNLAQGRFGSYTSYKYDHSDGWQNNNLVADDGELLPSLNRLSTAFTSNVFTQKFTYDATDRLSFYATGGYYWRMNERPVPREGFEGGNKYDTNYEGYSWGAGAKYRLGGRNVIQLDYNGNNYASRYKYTMESGSHLPGDYELTKLQKFHDVELKGIFGFTPQSTTVFGADFRREVLRDPDSDLDKGVSTVSAYGQHEVKLWDCLTGVLGARYDRHEEAGGRFTPKVAAMYSIGSFNVRATYAAGFRAPDIAELYYHMFKAAHGSRNTITLGNPDLEAERSNYYSVNMEYRTARFSASVTGYLNYVKHMVTSTSEKFDNLSQAEQDALRQEFPEVADLSSTGNLTVKNYYNFEQARVRGVQVNLAAQPVEGLTLSGNYTYAYARGQNADGTWQNIERSIRHTATLAANYVRRWGWYTMNLNLNGRVQSKVYYPGDEAGDAPGYGIWNLYTRHSIDRFRRFTLEPGIGVDNLFNKKDRRTLDRNFTLYSPGRYVVVSLALKLK